METVVKSVVFAARGEVVCRQEAAVLQATGNGAVIETRYSCISAGTELAKLTGLQAFDYPNTLGNRAIGRVVEAGRTVDKVRVGDLVFCHTPHVSHAVTTGLLVPLPDSLDRPETALIGMASVAITGLRVARPELGDTAVVLGAGLVGQFAAQLLRISGVRPILVDPVPERLEIARTCGIEETVVAGQDAAARVADLTGGQGAEYVFECSGVPDVVLGAPAFARRSGIIVLVGSPRGGVRSGDVTEFLSAVHLDRPHGDLTVCGAHEWKIPLRPTAGVKHSQARNIALLSDLIERGILQCRPLLSRVFVPERAADAYRSLAESPQSVLGAVFDWTTTGDEKHS